MPEDEDSATLDQASASILQNRAKDWRILAAKQQEVVARLQQAASFQRELAALSADIGDDQFESEARNVEELLHELTRRALHMEQHALEKVERTLADTSSILVRDRDVH